MTPKLNKKTGEPFNIVILGGGTAGWMAANLFVKKWPEKSVKITLVESPEIGIVGVGEGSTPTLKRFFETIDVQESQWMPRCNATYKMNVRFAGWSPKSGIESYSHPFTSQVDTFTTRAFTVNCRTRRLGLNVHTYPEDFLLNGVLTQQKKIPLIPDNFPFITEYGYHFDSQLLGEFLSEVAISRGVKHKQQRITQVIRAVNGDIAGLKTQSGEYITGDFFVDSTGFSSLLMQKTLGVKFNSYKENLFNDSAVVMATPKTDVIYGETIATALSAGWSWKIPLTSRVGNGYVYSSDFISPDEAEKEFRNHIGAIDPEQNCRHLKMKVGQLATHWSHNCIGIGLSQGFIEPLEATALHLVQISIELFIIKLEQGHFSDQYRQEFNQKMNDRFEYVRDYIVAHYKLNTREDSQYWIANRENENLSDPLCHILDVWFKRGDLCAEIERQNLGLHFNSISWHCLLAGYGAFPPLAKNQPGKGDLYQEKSVESFLHACALNFQNA